MVDSASPHATAATVLAALDAQRWSYVAACCAELPLAEIRDSVVRLLNSLHEHRVALPDTFDASEALREYGDDLADTAALQALSPRAFFTRYLSRPETTVRAAGPRTIDEVSVAGEQAVVRYRRPGAHTEELMLVRSAGEWQAVPNGDILAAVRLSDALWRRRFKAGR